MYLEISGWVTIVISSGRLEGIPNKYSLFHINKNYIWDNIKSTMIRKLFVV